MKNILKYIICFFVISYISLGVVFADWNENCKIRDNTAPVLEEYISNLRKVISNITSATQNIDEKTQVEKDLIEVKTQMIRLYNMSITWSWYRSNFDFLVIYAISNEYIYEIWRDYEMLDKEWSWLEKYSKAIVSRWLTSVNLKKENICKWLDSSVCNIWDWDILDVLSELQTNNELIKHYYRLSILDEKWDFKWSFKLVPNNFKQEFDEYYNWKTTADCIWSEWWFWEKAWNAMEKIWESFKLWSKWLKNWKEALWYFWITDNNAMRVQEYERQVLKNELSRQWISWTQADAILWNLERFNKEWIDWIFSNNFIMNSFNFIKNSFISQISEFDENVLQNFWWWDGKSNENNQTKSITQIETTDRKIKITKQVQDRISYMYNKELPSLKIQETWNEKLLIKLIDMHLNLWKAIKTLDSTVKIAEKVCNSQAVWEWKCSYK